MAAAKTAFPGWRVDAAGRARAPRAARLGASSRSGSTRIGAALALEVGKNRMEALGETQETADFFSGYAAEFERNAFYDHALPDDPLAGFRSHNRTVLKPYGVWAVIAPFNFPLALAGGPVAAALVTGNTVVLKGATDTPWAGRLLADCIRDAGFPAGVFNYVTGPGRVVGEALVGHPDLAGVTFTGSYDVGMALYRRMATGAHPRPCIAEMGGKNACIVTAHGRPGPRGHRHRALRLRPHRAEVLGALAGVRGGRRRRRAPREGAAEDRAPSASATPACARTGWDP